MNELQLFTNEKFGTIRTIKVEDKILFCASDVTKILGYSNGRDAINKHCRYVAKHDIPHPQSSNKTLEVSFITEGDVYRLIAHSKLPSAVQFESWVFDEVLPTIQKHGMYITDNVWSDMMNDPLKFAELLTAYGNERKAKEEALRIAEEKQRVIEEQAPKVKFHDDMEISETSVLTRVLANIYKEKGITELLIDGQLKPMGMKNLFVWFKHNGFMCKTGVSSTKNRPTKKAVDLGIMEEKVTTRTQGERTFTDYTTYITSKGIKYFMDKINRQLTRHRAIA